MTQDPTTGFFGLWQEAAVVYEVVRPELPIAVTLIAPSAAAGVFSPVELKVRVTSGYSNVRDATVKFYVDGAEVGSTTSGSYGYATYLYSASSPKTYQWYATAEKEGYSIGTSPTWTFTVTGIYDGSSSAVSLSPDPGNVGQGSTLIFTVTVQNTGPSSIPSAKVLVKIYRPDGQLASSPYKSFSAFTAGSERTVQVTYTLSSSALAGEWTYDVLLYRVSPSPTTVLDQRVGRHFTVLPAVRAGQIVSVADAPDPVLRGTTATFTVTIKNTGNIVWSTGKIMMKIYKPDGSLATTVSLTIRNVAPNTEYTYTVLSLLVPSSVPVGTYRYNVYLYYGTSTLLDSNTGNTITII
jgi:archaellum component FlaG (FlaF/FlaG flagellin family)